METVRHSTQESNPADVLAAQNEAVEKEVLKSMQVQNQLQEQVLGRKAWELQQKQNFLKEQILD